MKILPPTSAGYEEAAEALRTGEVVAYPTETVYGLAVDPFSESALEKLFNVKGRGSEQSVLLIIGEPQQLKPLVAFIPESAQPYIDKFWPGPLSLILPGAPDLPDAVHNEQGQVCVRHTDGEIAADLCKAFGGAITSTSANLTGQPPALSPDAINLPDVAFCIDGGELKPSPPSTIFDPEVRVVLREGVIETAQLLP